jgi:hypothetical protein
MTAEDKSLLEREAKTKQHMKRIIFVIGILTCSDDIRDNLNDQAE